MTENLKFKRGYLGLVGVKQLIKEMKNPLLQSNRDLLKRIRIMIFLISITKNSEKLTQF